MFSTTVYCWMRLYDWKMKPMYRLRTSDSSSSLRRATSRSPRKYSPLEGRSRQPSRLSIVLLPDPDAPMMATYSPWWKSTVTPFRACTMTLCSAPPCPPIT